MSDGAPDHDAVLGEVRALAGAGPPLTFDVVACDPDLADTVEFCNHYGYALQDSANTIVVVGKGEPRRFVACVVLADSRLDVNGVVRKRLAVRKASFASADETRELTGMAIGGVTAFGLPPELELWIDERVMGRERIVLGGGSRDRKLVLTPELLLRRPSTVVVEGLSRVV